MEVDIRALLAGGGLNSAFAFDAMVERLNREVELLITPNLRFCETLEVDGRFGAAFSAPYSVKTG